MKILSYLAIIAAIIIPAGIFGGIEQGYIESTEGLKAVLSVIASSFSVIALYDLLAHTANKIYQIKHEQKGERTMSAKERLNYLEQQLLRAIDIDNLPLIELLEAKINQIKREQQ